MYSTEKEPVRAACRELAAKMAKKRMSSQQLEVEKIRIAKKYSLCMIIKNSDILAYISDKPSLRHLSQFLRTKPVRTLSGVANIAVMWLGENGFSCPFDCVYCPKAEQREPTRKSASSFVAPGRTIFVPKSYLGVEPTTLRAIRNDYDPYLQVANRLKQLHAIGHATDKCELIVMGGTFLAWDEKNCTDFVKRCFDALNCCGSSSISEAQRINEAARNRCVGLTIETRADCCSASQIDYMLSLGTTRAEIGVQTTDDNLLRLINRGHDAAANTQAFERLKNAGLKITAHWMPGLTGLEKLDLDKEVGDFKKLFDNPAYRPDELKIYPTLVIPGTRLHELWKKVKYEAMDFEQTIDLLIRLKKAVPEYVRIKRVSRDISEHESIAGSGKTNLRQLANERMNTLGIKCRCIRCREVGQNRIKPESIELERFEYDASGGKEIFLSFEDAKNDILVAFLRLRIDSSEIAKIRELHVYGELAPIGAAGHDKKCSNMALDSAISSKMAIDFSTEVEKRMWQHRGFGKKLIEEAERIAQEAGKNKVRITSGVGAREYYKKLGYAFESPYMARMI